LRRSRLIRAAALGAVAVGVAAPALRRRLRLNPAAVSVLAWQAPVSLMVALPPSRVRNAAVYALQMWSYVAHYEMPADDHDRIRRRLRIDYPIAIDRALGLGETPTVRLQRALWREDRITRRDTVLSAFHWLWYFAPHCALVYVLVRRPDRFGRAAGLVAMTFDLGLIVYWVVPTAPPWWAGQNGYLPQVRRIILDVGDRTFGRSWPGIYDSLAGNPFAAMPSLHFATSIAAARALGEVGSREEVIGWAYAAGLGFALVYLGEHYVADLAAGYAVVELARRLVDSSPYRALEAGIAGIQGRPA
jgi:membrane-associated phospholipid phosphatase